MAYTPDYNPLSTYRQPPLAFPRAVPGATVPLEGDTRRVLRRVSPPLHRPRGVRLPPGNRDRPPPLPAHDPPWLASHKRGGL